MPRHIWRRDLRRRLCEILEHGAIGNRIGLVVGRLIVVLIVTNLVTMTLESVPALQAQYGPLFIAVELLSRVVFTIEYGLRVWVAAEHAPHRHSSVLTPSRRTPAPSPLRELLHLAENRLEFDLDQDRSLPSARECRSGRRSFVHDPRSIRGGCDARIFTATKSSVSAEHVRAIVAALDDEARRSTAGNRPPRLR